LVALVMRLDRLALTDADTLTVVDNRRAPSGTVLPSACRAELLHAPDHQSSYHARNRGAAGGSNPWLLFIDADVEPRPDLVDQYFATEPDATTAVLVGAIEDVLPDGVETLASRYACMRRLIDQANTLDTKHPYAKTANCAIRREAFEQVGGFEDQIRSGGDADLCFRLASEGCRLELRPNALVRHRARHRLVDLLGQRARHGSGAEWLEHRYPGFVGPRRRLRGLAADIARGAVNSALAVVHRNSDSALILALDPVSNAAFEFGRRVPNATWRTQRLRRGDRRL
jgi:hypothetical protein